MDEYMNKWKGKTCSFFAIEYQQINVEEMEIRKSLLSLSQ